MVDMAHIAGIVGARLHPSPVKYAHVVTSTTHKSLRGPRGGFILSTSELGKKNWIPRYFQVYRVDHLCT